MLNDSDILVTVGVPPADMSTALPSCDWLAPSISRIQGELVVLHSCQVPWEFSQAVHVKHVLLLLKNEHQGAGALVLQIRRLSCTRPTWVQSSVSYMVPRALSGVIREDRARSKP